LRFDLNQFIFGIAIIAILMSAMELATFMIAIVNGHSENVVGTAHVMDLVNIGLAGGLVALMKPWSAGCKNRS
jgi:Ca2+/Na+ antiporter